MSSPTVKRARVWNPAIEEEEAKPLSPDSFKLPFDFSAVTPDAPTDLTVKERPIDRLAGRLLSDRLQCQPVAFDPPPLSSAALPAPPPAPAAAAHMMMPFLLQLQLAPLMAARLQQQQQHHMEEVRRHHRRHTKVSSSVLQAPSSSLPSSLPSTSHLPPGGNPLVAAALGVQPASENCCAMCGAAFRLTGDLVQHMRNNHRTSKFKRKNDRQPVPMNMV